MEKQLRELEEDPCSMVSRVLERGFDPLTLIGSINLTESTVVWKKHQGYGKAAGTDVAVERAANEEDDEARGKANDA